jgi:hypothetical protein
MPNRPFYRVYTSGWLLAMVSSYSSQSAGFAVCWSSHGLEFVDAGAATREVELRGPLYESNMAVVSLFGHGDGVERTVGDPGVGGTSALAARKSCFGSLTRGHWRTEFSGVVRGYFGGRDQRLLRNGGLDLAVT